MRVDKHVISLTLRLRAPGRTLLNCSPCPSTTDLWGDGPFFLSCTRGNNMNRKETTTQRKRRLLKAKLKRQEKIANETDEQKRQRLERVRLAVARYRENESLEQRSERLLRDRIRTQQSRKNKPPAVNELREQHLARLERKRNLRQAQATKYNITDTSPTYDSKEELALCHRPENGYRTYRSARSRDTSQIVTTATTEASELGVLDPLQNLAPAPDAAIEDIKLNDHQVDDLSQILELAKKIAETVSKPNNTNRSFVEYVYTRLESMDPEESKAKIIQIADILEF